MAIQGQQHALHTHGKANAGTRFAATNFLHEAIVTTTATHSALRAQGCVLDFEGGLGVVVQAAHQIVVHFKVHTGCGQELLHAFKMCLALIAQAFL